MDLLPAPILLSPVLELKERILTNTTELFCSIKLWQNLSEQYSLLFRMTGET